MLTREEVKDHMRRRTWVVLLLLVCLLLLSILLMEEHGDAIKHEARRLTGRLEADGSIKRCGEAKQPCTREQIVRLHEAVVGMHERGQRRRLRQTMRMLGGVLDKLKIEWVVTAGTLLSVARERRISFLWDEEADICLTNPSAMQTLRAHLDATQEPLRAYDGVNHFKIIGSYPENSIAPWVKWRHWVDVFACETVYKPSVRIHPIVHLPLRAGSLVKTLPVPHGWKGYLNEQYGECWRSNARAWDHSDLTEASACDVPTSALDRLVPLP